LVGAIEQELAAWLSAGVDDCVVNGDTAGTHQDADVVASTDVRRSWNGLRKLAPAAAKTDGGGGALTASMLRTNRKKLGRAGAIGSQLVHIVSNAGAGQVTGDAAAITDSAQFTLPGQVAVLDGIPIIASDFVRQDLNATGVYDGTTTTRTVAITAN